MLGAGRWALAHVPQVTAMPPLATRAAIHTYTALQAFWRHRARGKHGGRHAIHVTRGSVRCVLAAGAEQA